MLQINFTISVKTELSHLGCVTMTIVKRSEAWQRVQ